MSDFVDFKFPAGFKKWAWEYPPIGELVSPKAAEIGWQAATERALRAVEKIRKKNRNSSNMIVDGKLEAALDVMTEWVENDDSL